MGVILYTLLAGELPFDDDCESIIQKKVVTIDYAIPSYFSEPVTDLIHKILKLNPVERPSIQAILDHPWLSTQQKKLTLPPPPTLLLKPSKENELYLSQSLLKAGIHSSVVEKMQSHHHQVGMLGTLWTMLLSSSSHHLTAASCATQTEDQTWLGSFKSWLNPNKIPLSSSSSQGAIHQQDKFISTTITTENKYPAFKCCSSHTTSPIIIQKDVDDPIMNTSSTCSSTADDEFDEDDHSSLASSPATSVAEEEDDDDEESDTTDKIYYHETAFHKVSPMVKKKTMIYTRLFFNFFFMISLVESMY